ncbi:YcaQ family DNA glycosylase [Micrococcales bacterium 31B]|nr:YcaQ family DNA glycosylase [Micrococcales bacterium 31B]
MIETLSNAQARGIALAAQGMAPRATRASGPTGLREAAERLGIIQLDSVNVFARAHLMPLFSRVGAYRTEHLTDLLGLPAASRPGEPARLAPFVEYWGHEASVVPIATRELLRFRMADFLRRFETRVPEWSEYAAVWRDTRDLLLERGPLSASQVREALDHEVPDKVHWGWNHSLAQRVLQLRFLTGDAVSVGRNAQFQRLYDVADRYSALQPLGELDRAESVKALLRIAVRAHGIGTVGCFADYFRLGLGDAAPAIESLVAEGYAVPVRVTGWDAPVYRYCEAVPPASLGGSALLSPFDPLVWERKRLLALFGMRYRIEIYVPAAKREYGYYCLPFLHRGAMAGRVDLKADRKASRLLVQALHLEPGAAKGARAALLREVERAAAWQGLDGVSLQVG